MAAVAEAEKLRQQGIDVVDLARASRTSTRREHIKEAAIAAMSETFRSTPPWAAQPN